MATLMFQPQFHGAVESGKKTQTIRPVRKRPIRPGEPLSLRAWSGKPYRSKQRVLRQAYCQSAEPIVIDFYWADEEEAARDGFASAEAMREWFIDAHGLPTPTQPFVGVRYTWK